MSGAANGEGLTATNGQALISQPLRIRGSMERSVEQKGAPSVTPWFPGNVNPCRVGVYQREFGGNGMTDVSFCLWSGQQWMLWEDTPADAAKADVSSYFQSLPWRGLASNPEASK